MRHKNKNRGPPTRRSRSWDSYIPGKTPKKDRGQLTGRADGPDPPSAVVMSKFTNVCRQTTNQLAYVNSQIKLQTVVRSTNSDQYRTKQIFETILYRAPQVRHNTCPDELRQHLDTDKNWRLTRRGRLCVFEDSRGPKKCILLCIIKYSLTFSLTQNMMAFIYGLHTDKPRRHNHATILPWLHAQRNPTRPSDPCRASPSQTPPL